MIALSVDTDKTARARAAAPTAEAGKIWIMRDAPWARLYLDELCNFPKSEFTDQVDSTTQFINYAKNSLGWSPNNRKWSLHRESASVGRLPLGEERTIV